MSRKALFLFVFYCKRSYNYGMNLFKKTKGFSLVEIVVVIGIMGILSAIIYSSFNASRVKSRDQKRVSDISAIQLSLEQYFQKNGIYPTQLSDLVPTYISALPVSPNANAGEKYYYFPLTKTTTLIGGTVGSNYCVSYQLWTKFELPNSYTNAKKSFDSTNLNSNKTHWYECLTKDASAGEHIDSAVDASSDSLIYDVMP
jgi:prepilin-type N-terminal cleavage/methylation domain-containing protein